MSAIEPNVTALLWFTLFWAVCCVGFLVLSGSFPLGILKERGGTGSPTLAIVNALAMLTLGALTLWFGFSELRITTLIVVGGLVALFSPAPFEIWPERWRDARSVLAALLVIQVGALAILYHFAGGALPTQIG